MEHKKITISKKGGGEYKVISIRIKEDTLNLIESIAAKTNRSRNEVINIILEDAASNIEISEE